VAQDLVDFCRMEVGKDGDRNGTHGRGGKEHHPPVRHIFAENCHAVSGDDTALVQEVRDCLDQFEERRVGKPLAADHGERSAGAVAFHGVPEDIPQGAVPAVRKRRHRPEIYRKFGRMANG
jgi:hypothetical protein